MQGIKKYNKVVRSSNQRCKVKKWNSARVAMTYVADLGQGQALTIENVGNQTIVTWESRSAGQQQTQQMSLSLGKWSASPMVFRTRFGFVLQIESNHRSAYVRIESNSISLMSETPLMLGAEEVPLRNVANTKSPETKPLEPLRMGNMSMQMEPMQMSMGNMNLSMATSTSSSTSSTNSSTPHFCSQCGTKVKERDRFCSHCGTKLDH